MIDRLARLADLLSIRDNRYRVKGHQEAADSRILERHDSRPVRNVNEWPPPLSSQ